MTTTLAKPKFELTTVEPKYGENYDKGYIGFTYHNDNVIAQGIAYFTKWSCISDIHATHALIVTGENSCIEADANQNCVRVGTLEHYFDEPNCQIFFRKPKGLTDKISDRIVQVLEPEVGKEYDFKSILTQLLSGTFPGHVLDRLIQGKFEDKLAEYLNDPNKWICSELAAYALDEQPEYRDHGILKRPNATISPQELFEDPEIFEPWKDGLMEECSK
jgi:hypothetical protein